MTALLGSGLLNIWFERNRELKEIQKQKNIRMNEDRLAVYRMVIDMFADILNDLETAFSQRDVQGFLESDKGRQFNRMRMQTFGYLCVYASQETINAHEELLEYIYDTAQERIDGNWEDMRVIAMKLLNCFRLDFDETASPVNYQGNR